MLYKRSVMEDTKCYFFAPSCPFFYQLLTTPKYSYESVKDFTKTAKMLHMDKILLPVNISEAHWVLAVINLTQSRFEYYDTMIDMPNHKEKGSEILDNLELYLIDEAKAKMNINLDTSEWKRVFYDKLIPHQNNPYDCGVFVCQFARSISQNKPIEFDQNHMQYFRRKMVIDIVKARI